MVERSTLALVRFGTGLAPDAPGADPDALLAGLREADAAARRFPIPGLAARLEDYRRFVKLRRAKRKGDEEAGQRLKAERRRLNRGLERDFRAQISRAIWGPHPFRERLVRFWTDHFTVAQRGAPMRFALPTLAEEAIRPHLTGRFADLLKAAALHPAMVLYLDQDQSFGPNSPLGRRRHRGLNENLAREILELHTLGVEGAYTQDDVRQFAELLTGVTFRLARGGVFVPGMAEPGAEIVLGRSYGGDGPARLADVHAALEDLAAHPDTARHIARKLAVHFVADDPPEALVAHLETRYRESGGDLFQLYAALLEHPAAWGEELAKARQPWDFLVAATRALGVSATGFASMPRGRLRGLYLGALALMGQPWLRAPGPNGWPEEAGAWITPQGLAARIDWAMAAPRLLLDAPPEPEAFLETALADLARPQTRAAVAGAESRWDAVGLVLAAPEFNRR